MNHRVLLLGFTVPDSVAGELFTLDPFPPVQTHRFAWSLTRSLRAAFGEVRLLSTCPVQSYPLVPRLLFRQFKFTQDGVHGISVRFVNLTVLKHLSRLVSALAMMPTVLEKWRVDTVFIHGVHTAWLLYGWLLSRRGVRIVPVLTDPPGVILSTDGRISRYLKRLDQYLVRFLIRGANVAISLSPALATEYHQDRRVLVFPGIVNRDWLDQLERESEDYNRDYPQTVLYAGGLNAAYGVDLLLDAARLLPEVRFVLLGKGDQIARIRSERLPNVEYRGFVAPEHLAPHLLSADILINPRPAAAEFAQQSFPSKLLEYVTVGRSVLTTRISSIPPSISNCFDYIEDETPEGIAEAILSVLSCSREERFKTAMSRRSVVLAEYSEDAVGRKIAQLLGG